MSRLSRLRVPMDACLVTISLTSSPPDGCTALVDLGVGAPCLRVHVGRAGKAGRLARILGQVRRRLGQSCAVVIALPSRDYFRHPEIQRAAARNRLALAYVATEHGGQL